MQFMFHWCDDMWLSKLFFQQNHSLFYNTTCEIHFLSKVFRKDTGTWQVLACQNHHSCLVTNECILYIVYKRPCFHFTLTDVTLLFVLSPCSATTAGLAVSPRQRPELTPSVGARGPVSRYLRINMSLLSLAIRDHIAQKKINHHPPNN